MRTVCLHLLLLTLLAGCTSQTAWEPNIDMDQETNPRALVEDRNYCQDRAFTASNTTARAYLDQDTLVAGTIGVVVGVVVGYLVRSPTAGAALGGAAGVHAVASDQEYRHRYSQCLVARGHPVFNP